MSELLGQDHAAAPERPDPLAASFRAGKVEAFRALVETYTRPLLAVAWRYTRDWESARDLCQETWIRVHESIQRYDPERPFRPWLFAIHRRLCLGHLRRAARRRERPVEESELRRLSPVDPGADPRLRVRQREFVELLQTAVRGLSERQRQVFAMVDIEQISQAEAAELLEMNFATLRSTLHFARRRVAEAIRKLEGSP